MNIFTKKVSKLIYYILILIVLSVLSCKSKIVDNETTEKHAFDDIEITNSMRLIGMHSHYNSNTDYEQYDFIINDKNDIISTTEQLKYGLSINTLYTKNEFNVKLLDGDKVVKTISINPDYDYIRDNGKTYKFDINSLRIISNKYSFRYTFEEKEFKTKKDFEQYSQKIKNDNKYLFMSEPDFKYEGEFNVVYLKNENFPNPRKAIEHIESELIKLTKKDNFRIFYVINEYNKNNLNQFTITIETNNKLYIEYNPEIGAKKDWTNNVYTTTIFSRK